MAKIVYLKGQLDRSRLFQITSVFRMHAYINMQMTDELSSLWSNFHKELMAYIQNKTRNHADTEDIIQDVFLKISRNQEKVLEAANMRSYIYGIVRNAITDHFRNRKQFLSPDELAEKIIEQDPDELNVIVADHCVRPFIDKLPAQYREALMIAEFQNVSQKELAGKLGISYSGARSRVQRGRVKLKELLMECCAYQSDVYGNLMDAEEKNCGCP